MSNFALLNNICFQPQNRIDAFAEVAKLFSDDTYNYTGMIF